VAPQSVGLPAGTRRRTPGLRREELAMLADQRRLPGAVGAGAGDHPSTEVLVSLATALQLAEPERLHLGHLGRLNQKHPGLCPSMTETLSPPP